MQIVTPEGQQKNTPAELEHIVGETVRIYGFDPGAGLIVDVRWSATPPLPPPSPAPPTCRYRCFFSTAHCRQQFTVSILLPLQPELTGARVSHDRDTARKQGTGRGGRQPRAGGPGRLLCDESWP